MPKIKIIVGTVAIGILGLVLSTILMENPYGGNRLFYGFPFLWVGTSRTLLIHFPPIPNRIILLPGIYVDFSLYSSIGLVFSYMVFTLNESKRLLRFFLKSGAVLVVILFLAGFPLTPSGPTPGAGPIGVGLQLVMLLALPLAIVCTAVYGYIRLLLKWKAKRTSASPS